MMGYHFVMMCYHSMCFVAALFIFSGGASRCRACREGGCRSRWGSRSTLSAEMWLLKYVTCAWDVFRDCQMFSLFNLVENGSFSIYRGINLWRFWLQQRVPPFQSVFGIFSRPGKPFCSNICGLLTGVPSSTFGDDLANVMTNSL